MKAAEIWNYFLMTEVQLQKISTCRGKITYQGPISQPTF